MATNYPTFQSDPNVNTLTASSGVTSSVGIFDKLYTPQFGVVSNTEFGVLEAGGPYGAYLDLKKPYSDDFDIRLMSDAQIEGGGYLLNAGGAILSLSGANVGIGTFAPSAKMYVHTAPQWSSNNYGANIVVGGNTRNNAIGLLDSTDSNPWAIANTGGKLQFSTMPPLGNTSSTPSQYVTFNNNGDVGIGVTAPPSKFSVAGSQGNANGITVTSVNVATIITHDPATNGGMIQVKSGGSSTSIGPNNYRLLLQPEGGNIGIGTTSPDSKLHVNGTITVGTNDPVYQAGVLGYTDANFGFLHRPPQVGSIGAHHFEAYNGTDLLTIQNGGNVGIGTTSPSRRLDVSGIDSVAVGVTATTATAAAYPQFIATLYNNGFGGQPVIELFNSRGTVAAPASVVAGEILGGFNTWGQNGAGFQSATRIEGIAETTFSSAVSSAIRFITTAAGTQSEKVRITSGGNVGIGTTSPVNKLAVYDNSGTWEIVNAAQANATSYALYRATNSGGNTADFGIGAGASTTAVIRVNGTEKVAITSGGDVGIGTSTPDAKLTVNGAIKLNAQGVGEGGEIQLARAGDNAIKWAIDVIGSTDSTSNLRFFDNTGSAVMLLNTSTKAVEVYSGIKFPDTQVPSADVNTLDDYEEGGWIPTIYSAGSGITYDATLTSGSYVKIGRAVMLNGTIALTSTGSATSFIFIANLPFPFPSGAQNRYSATFGRYLNLGPNVPAPMGSALPGTSWIAMFKTTTTSATQMQITDLTNTTTIYFSMHYNV